MGTLRPTREQSEHAFKLATKRWEERPMNNDIKHLKNGDFEVVNPVAKTEGQTHIDPPQVDGRRKVYWMVNGYWVHKGWLKPQVT